MAETEVESILREIRERVISQQGAGRAATTQALQRGGANGAGDSLTSATSASPENGVSTRENLALINAYLATTARAWDRLPPLLSNRSGATARLELWLKRILKRATHWYTWEQVNFNAAVHHALRDGLPVLAAYEQNLAKSQAQLAALEVRSLELEQSQAELRAQLTALQTELRNAISAQSRAGETTRNQIEDRFAALANESRERHQQLLDEQRVCFKQLALEASEAAVLEDRARRKTEALLEELQHRIAQIEK